jgi:phage-related tail protein
MQKSTRNAKHIYQEFCKNWSNDERGKNKSDDNERREMSQKISNEAYNRMITKTGLTFQERRKEETLCELCGTILKPVH